MLSYELLRHLIDFVQIRPLFAIDLDVDEPAVHQCGGRGVFEGFVRHDVAPVAGRITPRQENRLVPPLPRGDGSSPQGYQSTGLSACCLRYGLVSSAR